MTTVLYQRSDFWYDRKSALIWVHIWFQGVRFKRIRNPPLSPNLRYWLAPNCVWGTRPEACKPISSGPADLFHLQALLLKEFLL